MAFREEGFRVAESSATTGTGSLVMGGALTGYFAVGDVLANGDTAPFLAEDTTGAWELFLGTYTSGTNTLARTTRLASSTGASINFGANKVVSLVYPGLARLIQLAAQKATTVAADRVPIRDSVTGALMYAELGGLLPAGSVMPSKLATGDTSNIYPDPDMLDEGAYTTTSSASLLFTASAADAGSGKRQLRISGSTDAENALSPDFILEEGFEYHISAWMEASGSGSGYPELYVKFYSDHAATVDISQTLIGARNSTAPARVGAVVTAPADTKRARILFNKVAGDVTRNAHFSGIQVRQLPDLDDIGAEPEIPAGTATDYWTGSKSWADFAAAVRSAVLTGLSTATNAAIAATDSALAAFGKLQAQITALLARQVIAGNGMTGGGTLSADRTLTLGTPSTLTPSTTNAVTSTSHTHALDLNNIDLTPASITFANGTGISEYGSGSLATAVGGSTAGGTLISGRASGHIAMVINGNDDTDSFAVVSHDAGVYTRLLSFVRTGVATFAGRVIATHFEGGMLKVAQYTLATLPSAAANTGRHIEVTDASGGPKLCRSDGSVWKILNTSTTVS